MSNLSSEKRLIGMGEIRKGNNKIRNSNIEIRNKFQIQNSKLPKVLFGALRF